ncbi:MAG: WYL domain-containing protein [Clostridia bacterium]
MIIEKNNILCILAILFKYSDDYHILSMPELQKLLLNEYELALDRRTIYRNIENLIDFGYDIATFEENRKGYYFRERIFELSELNLLSSAIFSADFISKDATQAILAKIRKLCSKHQLENIEHLIYLANNKNKTNKEFFYNVELLNEAIRQNKKVEFDYITYGLDKVQRSRRKRKYIVNPYATVWSNEQYYLICNYEPYAGDIAHYRVDRIKNIKITELPLRPAEIGFDPYLYAQETIHMFGGAKESFTLKCEMSMLNAVLDQFGEKTTINPLDDNYFEAIILARTEGMRVWIRRYFNSCEVISPQWLRDFIISSLQEAVAKYHLK